MQINRIQQLFQKYYLKSISEQERQELFKLLSELNEQELEEVLNLSYHQNFGEVDDEYAIDQKGVWHKLSKILDLNIENKKRNYIYWLRVASIAAILISITIFGAVKFFPNKDINTLTETIIVEQDVPPGRNKAILTLANGEKVNLDTLSIGKAINDGNILIEKLDDGNIRYTSSNSNGNASGYNTIETPTGGTYHVILPDGSNVWLNALSKLKYPTNFGPESRNVELEGEAYFEIAHNKKSPFYVHLSSHKIKVLGTKFNVNTYHSSSDITSVIDGSVNVFNENTSKILTKNQGLKVQNGVFNFYPNHNASEDISWVDGYFCRSSIKLNELLEQMIRWYGIDVVNKRNLNNEFVLSLKRDIYLKDLIRILELTNEVKLEFKNNVLYVSEVN